MIYSIQSINQEEVIEFFMEYLFARHKTLMLSVEDKYTKEDISSIALDVIKYIELQINCNLIQLKVKIRFSGRKVILPFWPIEKIISIRNDNNLDLPYESYKIDGNKLEIFSFDGLCDSQESNNHVAEYSVGYTMDIIKEMSVNILAEKMVIDYMTDGNWKLKSDLSDTFNKIQNVYGIGD